jgi:uncharacterized cupin superfamily protein
MTPMSSFGALGGPRRIDAHGLDLAWSEVSHDQVLAGRPRVGSAPIAEVPGLEVGVWAHSPGASTDVEADEVFVVLAGRATIRFDDGTVLDVGPGDVGVLPAGAATTWTVHEELRKVYVIRTG